MHGAEFPACAGRCEVWAVIGLGSASEWPAVTVVPAHCPAKRGPCRGGGDTPPLARLQNCPEQPPPARLAPGSRPRSALVERASDSAISEAVASCALEFPAVFPGPSKAVKRVLSP